MVFKVSRWLCITGVSNMSKIVNYAGACPHDCPDTCAMVYEVQDKKLLSVKGNAEHPMTQGGLCVKLKDYEKRH